MREADPKQMTKSDLKHWGFGVDALKMIEHDLMGYLHEYRALPSDWDKIWEEQDKRDPKRVKITISLDDDLVRFFKGMGPGYQPRMNRVLRAFMHFRLAKLIEGPDTMDYILRPQEVMDKARRKPEWGDTERMVDEIEAEQEARDKRKQSARGSAASVVDDPFAPKGR